MINLNTIISKHVNMNTLIMTDCCREYLNVKNIEFLDKRINHSRNSVDPQDKSIYTQNIECFWSYLKKYIRSRGKNLKKKLKYYLKEFKFLKSSKNPFEKF
ncbi:hypothetical protein CDIK_4131, partial [Cucumispora dikerogammari]